MTRKPEHLLKNLVKLALLVSGVLLVTSGLSQHAQMDLTKTVGIESCAECHEEIVDRWAESTHATSFETLLKTEAAGQIAEVVGLQTSKIAENASCVRCHFTREFRHSAPITTESISCESCHGPAIDWIDEHNKKSLSRAARVANSSEKGMRHPEKIYDSAKACFECHVVDDEQLVNHTVHPALSEGFELVSWYSGETAHNFLISSPGRSTKKHGSTLQPLSIERQRMLYITGKLLHLSQTLKVLSRSTDAPVDANGEFLLLKSGLPTFAVQHAIQARKIAEDLKQVTALVEIPEVKKAVNLYSTITFKTGQGEAIGKAADEIDLLAKTFTEERNGSDYPRIDPILQKLVPRYPEGTTDDALTKIGIKKDEIEKVTTLIEKIQQEE